MGKGRGRGGGAEEDEEPSTFTEDIKAFWVNDGPRYLIGVLWFAANVGLFFGTYVQFDAVSILPSGARR